METTPLERVTRQLADEFMEANPGVARQRAKAIVRPRAQMVVAVRNMKESVARFMDAWYRATRGNN